MLRPRRIPTIALLLGLLTLGMVAHAQKDPRADAKAHYTAGKKLYEQGQWEQAIEEFRTADQLAPSGVNDFNIALCYEGLGQPANAARFYRSYLVRMPDAANRAAVEESITRLEAQAKADADREAENARQAAADAEARRIEEAQRAKREPPPDDVGGTHSTEAAPSPATGDPELDRVAGINVGEVRDQRGLPPVANQGAVAPPPAGAPAPAPAEPKKSKPVYKQWWFWVVVGVSAYVLITILADNSQSTSQPRLMDMPSPAPAAGGGFTVLHF